MSCHGNIDIRSDAQSSKKVVGPPGTVLVPHCDLQDHLALELLSIQLVKGEALVPDWGGGSFANYGCLLRILDIWEQTAEWGRERGKLLCRKDWQL